MGRTMQVGAWALVAAVTSSAGAVERHVPAQYPSIQAAINAAGPGDTVIVAPGTYTGIGNRNLSFGGKAITVRSTAGAAATIIAVQATPEHPARGVQFISGEGPASVLEGFTITGGATLPGAIDDMFNGGGILVNNGSSPTIRSCVIQGNQCGCWGAAICCTDASPMIVDCALLDNAADDNGGGLFAWGTGGPTIVNTLIAGNDGGSTGGGVALFSNGTTIVNCTIVGNTANVGAGVHASSSTIVNSIVWGSGASPIIGAPFVSFSNVQGGYNGTGNLNVDPMFVDAAGGDYHLSAASPLLDAGSMAMIPAGVEFDFDGDPRVIGDGVDIGGDEVLLVGDVNFDGGVDVADLVDVMLAWGACDGCPEDLTDDGLVNVADMTLIILNWGP